MFSRANAGTVEIPYAFQPKTERGTLPDHLLRGSGASWDRFDKGMTTPPESCSKLRPSAFRKTGLHTHACSSRKRRGAGSPVARTLPRPLQNTKKLGCGMVFKPHSCFLEQMLAMLRYPMRSSRKRSVEPSRTTCLGVPGRPGTVSTRAWRLRRNPAPNVGQVHSAKRACTPMRVQAANDAALGAPSHASSLDPFKTPKNWGAAWCLSPIRVF